MRLSKQIDHAISGGELFLEYQPVVECDGRLVGHEALVRWRHPRRGLLPPAAWIPMIEHRSAIEALSWWTIEVVAGQAASWQRAGHCGAVAVNLSGALLSSPKLATVVARELDAHHLDPELLTVEVTESFLIANQHRSVQVMHQLGELGVRRSIDDFGAGFTSLRMLKVYPIDELKIDRIFTRDVVTSPVDRAVIAALVELGHRLGVTVVGEGVETEAVAAALTGIGCDRLQGYLFGRPSPATADVIRALQT